MQSVKKENLIFMRLLPEEDVNRQLINVCKKYKISTAVIISAIGQIKKVKLGFFKKPGNYSPKLISRPLEILSLSGLINKEDNDYNLHLHIIVGDENKKALGGHFIEGLISITAEIVLLISDVNIKRKKNNKTGLKDLVIE